MALTGACGVQECTDRLPLYDTATDAPVIDVTFHDVTATASCVACGWVGPHRLDTGTAVHDAQEHRAASHE